MRLRGNSMVVYVFTLFQFPKTDNQNCQKYKPDNFDSKRFKKKKKDFSSGECKQYEYFLYIFTHVLIIIVCNILLLLYTHWPSFIYELG